MITKVALCGEVRASPLLAPLPNGLATQLFAYLVLHRRRPLQHAALADALWTGQRPRKPRAVVSSLLSRLRRSLGPDVLPTGAAVRLVLPAGAVVDVDEAAAALLDARAALDRDDADGALGRAERAREIAGRGLLVDFDARWIDPWRSDVEATHLDALELIARAGARLGGEAARDGERAARHAIARAPLRESAHAALMETLAALDEGGAALQVYEQLRIRLDAELGAVPSAAVRELHQRLLAGDAAAAPPVGAEGSPVSLGDSGLPRARAAPTVAQRLAAVGPQAAAVAERVAALGEVAGVELLVALDGGDRPGTLARLQQCYDAGLLAPASSWLGPSATLADAADAEPLLAAMPATAPAQIAAAALRALRDDDGDPVAIARLALRAVPAVARDEAVALARAGVELLLRGRAFPQAAELAERALEVGPGRRDRVALLLDHGRALRHVDPDRAWRAAASAFSAASELDDPLLLARAALATGATGAGERATAADGGLARRLREALDRLPAAPAEVAADAAAPAADDAAAPDAAAPGDAPATADALVLRARLLARLSVDRSWVDPAQAEQLAREAGESAEAAARAGGRELPLRALAQVELARIGARRDPARTRGRLDAADALAARARAEGDRAVELAALLQGLTLLGELGRAAAVRASVARIELLASALGDSGALRLAADTRLIATELAAAGAAPGFVPLDAPRRAAPANDAAGPDPSGWARVRLRMARGTVAGVLGEIDDLVRLQPTLDGPRALAALARLLAGDPAEARSRLAATDPQQLEALSRTEGGQLHTWSALGFVAARTGAREHAAVLYELLRPFGDRHAVAPWSTWLTPVARVQAELAGALGRPQEARERFRAAVAAAEAVGAASAATAIRRELGRYAPPLRDRL